MPPCHRCLGCKRPLGKGTRFNARKEKAGKYYTTTIWAFAMKCPSCSEDFVIETDPQNSDYKFCCGLRRSEQRRYEPDPEEHHILTDEATQQALANDPLYALEHAETDKRRAAAKKERITKLMEWSEDTREQDYDLNAALRRSARGVRKEARALADKAEGMGLGIELLPHNDEDASLAASMELDVAR